MEMTAFGNTNYPFHSFKFYEAARNGNKGWHIRGDFEWQMYAVVEYNTCRPPKITVKPLSTTIQTTPRTLTAKIEGVSDCGGKVDSVMLQLEYDF